MERVTKLLVLTGLMAGSLAAAPQAFAHATYNVGGFSDISVGALGTNARAYTGGTTGGGVAGSLNQSGATNSNEVWVNGVPGEWVGPTGPNKAPPSTGSVLPSQAYVGLHSNVTSRLMETGNYCGATAAVDCIGAPNLNTNSLLRQVYNRNHAATANYVGGPFSGNLLPTDLSMAVAANSWGTGTTYETGMDILSPHISTGTGSNLEQNVINLAPAGSQVYLNIDVYGENAGQQMGVSLFGGWDDGNGMSDLTLISSTLAAVNGHATLSYLLQGTYFGEYTVLIGDASNVGGQYKANFSITTVPVPAAVWLLGSALMGLGVIGRRKAMA